MNSLFFNTWATPSFSIFFSSLSAFQMKLLQSVKSINLIAFRRELVNFYSTFVNDDLYRRLSPVGDPNISIVPILDQWVSEGRPVQIVELRLIIKELRVYKRYKHALEMSKWMSDKVCLPLSTADIATRMNLILRVHGLEQVEDYFNNMPSKLKRYQVHIALLNCYAHEKCVDKANALLQKIKELGFATTPHPYNIMMNLYHQIGEFERLDSLMKEMKERGLYYDRFTYSIRLSAYATASDCAGIEKITEQMESNTSIVLDWNCYVVAADAYYKVGLIDKSISMLKKSEELLAKTAENKCHAFNIYLTLYAKNGKKDETYRIWNLYKKEKVFNKGFISMITSLLILDDIKGARRICEEWETQVWETQKLSYDLRIPNLLVDAYCRAGLMEEAEVLVYEMMTVRRKFSVKSWCYIASGYLQKDQLPEAVETLKIAASLCPSKLDYVKEILAAFLDGKQDVEEVEKVVNLLREKDNSHPARGHDYAIMTESA
ncbi:hypothetical protein IC582_029376 [Cucumis melo]